MTRAAVAEIAPETFVYRRCVKQRIDIVETRSGPTAEDILRRINVGLRLVQPEIVEAVGLDIAIANLLPPPLRGLRIGGVDVRSDDVL